MVEGKIDNSRIKYWRVGEGEKLRNIPGREKLVE